MRRAAGMNRRPDGALELWGSNRPLMPSEVLSQLDTQLAYTSVATVLNRLHAKGLVARQMSGRAFRYRATVSEGEMVARSIGTALQSATDRRTAMARFVSSLSKRDVRTLRSILDELDR